MGEQHTPENAISVGTALSVVIAGMLTVVAAFLIAMIGIEILHAIIASGVSMGTALAAGVVIFTVALAPLVMLLLTILVAEGVTSTSPRTNSIDKYSITGGSGLVGVGMSVLAIALTLMGAGPLTGTVIDPLISLVPRVVEESLVSTGVVLGTLTLVYYRVLSPGTPDAGRNAIGGSSRDVDAESVRQQTENVVGSQENHPAYPPGEGPNTGMNVNENPGGNWDTDDSTSNADSRRGQESGDSRRETDQNPSRKTDSRQNEGSGRGVDATELQFNWQMNTGVSFADVGGMADLKRELQDEVIKPIEQSDRAEELGITPPNIIFHGPPGTGKTFMAQALSTELELPFVHLSGADLMSKWINESATTVNALFAEARRIASVEGGALIFLDELDTVLKDRSDGGRSHEEDKKVVNEFLNHLEDTRDHGIVFIGATNRLDALDEAGIRSGRIDKKVEVGKPDIAARRAVLRTQLRSRSNDVTAAELQQIAQETDGFVPADLEALVVKAATRVFSRGAEKDSIQESDLRAAVQEMSDEADDSDDDPDVPHI